MKFDPDLQTQPSRNARVGELDALRVAACGAVLLWHALVYTAAAAPTGSRPAWSAAAQLFALGGPVFFFLSALLCFHRHPEGEPLRGFWGRRLLLLGVPYVVWSIVGLLLQLPAYRQMSPLDGARAAGMSLAFGIQHLAFLNALVQFYLLFPLLRWVWNRADRGALVAAGLLLGFGWLEGAPRLLPGDLPPGVYSAHAGFLPAWMPYVVLGAWAAPHVHRLGRLAPRPWVLWAASLALLTLSAVLLSARLGSAAGYAGAAHWSVALFALLWLPFLLRWAARTQQASRSMWRELARLTPAVFFAHALPLGLAALVIPMTWPPAARLPLLLLAAGVGTGFLIRLLRRNPTAMLLVGLVDRPVSPVAAAPSRLSDPARDAAESEDWRDDHPLRLTVSSR